MPFLCPCMFLHLCPQNDPLPVPTIACFASNPVPFLSRRSPLSFCPLSLHHSVPSICRIPGHHLCQLLSPASSTLHPLTCPPCELASVPTKTDSATTLLCPVLCPAPLSHQNNLCPMSHNLPVPNIPGSCAQTPQDSHLRTCLSPRQFFYRTYLKEYKILKNYWILEGLQKILTIILDPETLGSWFARG